MSGFSEKGVNHMATTPSPVLTPPKREKDTMLATAKTSESKPTAATVLVKSLPLIGMGGVLAAGISAPAGIAVGAGILAAEVILGALTVIIWFPPKKL